MRPVVELTAPGSLFGPNLSADIRLSCNEASHLIHRQMQMVRRMVRGSVIWYSVLFVVT